MTLFCELGCDMDDEIRYEECSDPVYFHLEECPVCHERYARTSYCGVSVDELIDDGLFSCEECGSQFKLVSYDCCREKGNAEVEILAS